MLNLREYLIERLAEECAEVIQRCTKANSYGLHEVQPGQELNNEERIRLEFTDIIAVAEMLRDECSVYILPNSREAKASKKRKVHEFMEYSREQGALEPAKPFDPNDIGPSGLMNGDLPRS